MSSLSDNVIPVTHSATSSVPADNASSFKALQDHVARLEQLILRQNNAGVGQPKDTTGHGLVTSQPPAATQTDDVATPEVNIQNRNPPPLPSQQN